MKTITLLIILLIPLALVFAENSPEYTEAKLEWSKFNYGLINGTGTAKIVLTDFDAPNIPNYIDTVTVFVYSDSFPEGINLTLYETEKNSGIFERTFSLSDTRSAPGVLYVREGDTAIVTYADDTLPFDHVFSEIYLMETTLIGTTGPPLERVPTSNARIIGLDGDSVTHPVVGEQILLMSDIASQQDTPQEFIWIAQTIDSQNKVQFLSWINGTINPRSSFSPSTSWIPQATGEYRTVFFVWESIDNPTALSPPVEIEYTVESVSYTLTEIQCLEGQLLHDNECIFVIGLGGELPAWATNYFLIESGMITQYCKIETSSGGASGVTMESCNDVLTYSIIDNEIEFVLESDAYE
ncbi:hypothetical protein BD31_I0804 [Candidatus Nitrosopumilus salaria BD31]|uniref:Uncharacterized protein n=1 Tax=Candidatus Nitrosopumilus salarius BD31 TaxID=859350 RepID=I3D228_9ARCH|nr:hypothetical protein [Candidatus Nitrosopumilus salaria]EIJ65771.1 hypothetical protein BD31_I0804 [Candidatus Nitrosopumilus salaria BD31]